MIEEILSNPYYFILGSEAADAGFTAFNMHINSPNVEAVRSLRERVEEKGIVKGLLPSVLLTTGILTGLTYGAHLIDERFGINISGINVQDVVVYGIGGLKYFFGGIHLLQGTVGLISENARNFFREHPPFDY